MTIDKILESIEQIPAFPHVVQKVADLLSNDDYSVKEVVDVIKYDQSITANILKMSNSVYFGARAPVRTIQDAVVYLGQQHLIRAVQMAGVLRFFKVGKGGNGAELPSLWEHSVAVALMSQILSHRVGRREDQALYTAALLHDIGKVILGEFVHEALPKIRVLVTEENLSFLEAEEEVIGINHADVGGRIAAHWNFPEDIAAAIAYHHRPDLLERSDEVIPWLVYFSDHLCRMIGIDGGLDSLHHRALADALQKFNFRIVDLEWSFVQLWRDLERAKELLRYP